MSKYIYAFAEGDGKNKQLLGGKGANLCEMTQFGLNVPPGFVITTEACLDYLKNPQQPLAKSLLQELKAHISEMEKASKKGFGSADNPLLVSVRSGSAMSMPGMMDTILNLGLNEQTLQGLIQQTHNERFAYDAYRRFIQLFGKVALGIEDKKFDEPFEVFKKQVGAKVDLALSAYHLKEISQLFLQVVKENTGQAFPQDVFEQLDLAIKAVFRSWLGKRAVDYRREFNITPDMAKGTAVNIVTMVFGNMGNDSATGVGFTRNPGTGENQLYGEYLVNAQGEDVVAGIRTPRPVHELAADMPEMYAQLLELREKLEKHYAEVQDFEYTIEKGDLYCLQTRNGKMNATATVRTSVEMFEEGLISKEQALLRIQPDTLEQLLHPRLDPEEKAKSDALTKGLPASPGAASGEIVFDADRAEYLAKTGKKVILVREETKPEDIHGFFAAQGILTSRGGKTSHAAVVARGMGKPCVAGAEGISIDDKAGIAKMGGKVLHESDIITIDGATGEVFSGAMKTLPATFSDELKKLLVWADETAHLQVMANTDTPEAAQKALEYGAKGIGLCRTERMFNAQDRLPLVIEMILADTTEARQHALDKLLPIQRQDFEALFTAMSPHPVTIRLLDPPIHEFLPSERQLETDLEHMRQLLNTVGGVSEMVNSIRLLHPNKVNDFNNLPIPFNGQGKDLLNEMIEKKEEMLQKVRELYEVNPMLGHRGVRLGITYPEIYVMQIRAVLEAAAKCQQQGIQIKPQIMVPQVCTVQELSYVKQYVNKILQQVEADFNCQVHFQFGSMIEVVRACMRAEQLAEVAEFFSFGTNDLSQATFSFSREDAENKFLPLYNETEILTDNPFEVLDTKGVGKLMEITVEWGRKAKPDLKVGICGEQGGHPASIAFCHNIGLDYVSCSPLRIPVARLAAAQAKLLEKH